MTSSAYQYKPGERDIGRRILLIHCTAFLITWKRKKNYLTVWISTEGKKFHISENFEKLQDKEKIQQKKVQQQMKEQGKELQPK